jgi:NTP pyrophosphatase (non-canonical NTP hydrolase)
VINEDSTLPEIQEYIWQLNINRGFDLENPEKKMLLLTEEVGEVARALRKRVGLKFDISTHQSDIADEIADVFIVLSGLASMTGVDLLSAVMAKERKNKGRNWQ